MEKELTGNSLVSGISLAIGNNPVLKSKFNTIAKDVIKEEFERPGIFITDAPTQTVPQLHNSFMRTQVIDLIVYSYDDKKVFSFMREIEYELLKVLRTVDMVDKDLVSIGKANCYKFDWNVVDDIGHFLITYKYRIVEVKTEEEKDDLWTVLDRNNNIKKGDE